MVRKPSSRCVYNDASEIHSSSYVYADVPQLCGVHHRTGEDVIAAETIKMGVLGARVTSTLRDARNAHVRNMVSNPRTELWFPSFRCCVDSHFFVMLLHYHF